MKIQFSGQQRIAPTGHSAPQGFAGGFCGQNANAAVAGMSYRGSNAVGTDSVRFGRDDSKKDQNGKGATEKAVERLKKSGTS